MAKQVKVVVQNNAYAVFTNGAAIENDTVLLSTKDKVVSIEEVRIILDDGQEITLLPFVVWELTSDNKLIQTDLKVGPETTLDELREIFTYDESYISQNHNDLGTKIYDYEYESDIEVLSNKQVWFNSTSDSISNIYLDSVQPFKFSYQNIQPVETVETSISIQSVITLEAESTGGVVLVLNDVTEGVTPTFVTFSDGSGSQPVTAPVVYQDGQWVVQSADLTGLTGETITASIQAVDAQSTPLVTQYIDFQVHDITPSPEIDHLAELSGEITGTISEDMGTDNVSGHIDLHDIDGPNDTTFKIIIDGKSERGLGTISLQADGTWTYTLDNSNSEVQVLGAGETITDTFIVETTDGQSEVITITITGTDDSPTVAHEIQNVSVVEDIAFSYQIPSDTFVDITS